MTRLRRVSPASAGWTRRRVGRGFLYLDEDGARLDPDLAARCRALVIPPAWTDVWICPLANGHIQAVGTDAAGRRQYLYHPAWREQRDAAKHERILEVARRLPRARRRAFADLTADGMPRERALATAFRLLDLGLFRVGGETYAEENGSYGLATIEKRHVVVSADQACFEYTAKSGLLRSVVVHDRPVVAAVAEMRRRRNGGAELLAFRDGRRWRDISSADINDYVKSVIGGECSAKDFRTWHGTVRAAVALAERCDQRRTKTARARAVRDALRDVSEDLGNTVAVARKSYVDPRVVDHFEDGLTIAPALQRIPARAKPDVRREKIERAVLRLLTTD